MGDDLGTLGGWTLEAGAKPQCAFRPCPPRTCNVFWGEMDPRPGVALISRRAFNPGSINIRGQLFVVGTVLCIQGCLAASFYQLDVNRKRAALRTTGSHLVTMKTTHWLLGSPELPSVCLSDLPWYTWTCDLTWLSLIFPLAIFPSDTFFPIHLFYVISP